MSRRMGRTESGRPGAAAASARRGNPGGRERPQRVRGVIGDRGRVARGVRRHAVAGLTAASLGLGFLTAEATLIAPVVFLAAWLGFWPGMAVFVVSCVLFGLAVLWATVRFWPERAARSGTDALAHGPLRRRIGGLARRWRWVGALAVAWYCGPFASPPILRALGYHGRSLVLWVLASGGLFGAFWYGFYGGGLRLLRQALP